MKHSYLKRFTAAVCALAAAVTSLPIVGFSASELKYEAESAALSGVATHSDGSYSGGKYVSFQDSGSCKFTVNISESGLYDLNFISSGQGGSKFNNALLDNESIGQFESKANTLSDSIMSSVYMEKGTHTIEVNTSWGWINLDCLILTKSVVRQDIYNVSNTLINPNASGSAREVMSFIAENYGKNVISGQQCDDGRNGKEFLAIENLTGKTHAILGMDLMRYTPARVKRGDSCKTVEYAIEFSREGGLVELCWHWNAPDKYLKSGTDSSGNPRWWGGFYTENVNMDLSSIMDGKDPEGYNQLMADIDAIAVQLKKLQDADVPVLFRPLHEASGGWFWWGSDGAAPYKKLWKTVYDKLTNEHGLNNLIWVWNGQDKNWYPGDNYVDIIGEDIYPGNHVYGAQSSRFIDAANCAASSKVVALTENGCLFDVDQAIKSGTLWSWFCVWGGDFCVSGSSISEKYTEKYMWKKVYGHQNVLTLEDMPRYDASEKEISSLSITVPSATYTGSAVIPKVTVKDGSRILTKDVDYTINCTNNTKVGTAKVTITGKGKYKGSVTKTFKINQKSVSSLTATLSTEKYTYNGSAKKPEVTLRNGTKKLVEGTDYTVTYSNNINAGTAKVTVTGKGNYSGTLTKTFVINPMSLSNAVVSDVSTQVWTGSALKPAVSAKLNGKKLSVSDYSVSYSNNTNVGKAEIIIKGKGNYTGTLKKNFKIIPKKQTVKSLVAKSKAFKVSYSKHGAATGYQIQYSVKSDMSAAKSKYIKSKSTTSKTITGLSAKKTYYVRVRTYTQVGSTKYYGAWSAKKSVKTN